jgi:hypothetical protein
VAEIAAQPRSNRPSPEFAVHRSTRPNAALGIARDPVLPLTEVQTLPTLTLDRAEPALPRPDTGDRHLDAPYKSRPRSRCSAAEHPAVC